MNRMLQAGIYVNITDSESNTALHVMFIQMYCVLICIKILLSGGIHVNKLNTKQQSAIEKWMSECGLKELKLLITKTGDSLTMLSEGRMAGGTTGEIAISGERTSAWYQKSQFSNTDLPHVTVVTSSGIICW